MLPFPTPTPPLGLVLPPVSDSRRRSFPRGQQFLSIGRDATGVPNLAIESVVE